MPQPIDMQTEMARATLADRVQQATDRAALAAAMRARLEREDEQAQSETHVDQTPETQSEHIDPELKRRTPYAGRRKRKAAEHEDESKRGGSTAPPAGPAGHHFDVSI